MTENEGGGSVERKSLKITQVFQGCDLTVGKIKKAFKGKF